MKLRELFDNIQNCIQNLKALKIMSDSYGPILIPCIFSKLPEDLRLDLTKSVQLSDWNLDQLLIAMENEIRAREACGFVSGNSANSAQPVTHQQKNFRTNHALHQSSQPSPPQVCVFCESDSHKPWDCPEVTHINERKAIISAKKLCFNCLNKSHQAAKCRSKKSCFHCKQRHHSSICPENSLEKNDASCNVAGTSETSGVVFLKTAKTWALNPGNSTKREVRILIDEGSQRTYVTYRLCSELNLEPVSSSDLIIRGACGQSTTVEKCDTVNLCLQDTKGESYAVTANVLKNICHPLSPQPIISAQRKYAHLRNLAFSDSHKDSESLPIDILLGADWCNLFMTASQIRGKHGEPIASLTKFGWVLLGPMANEEAQNNRQTVQSCVTHVLKCTEIDASGDENLHKFWDLESIGIMPEEKMVHETFENDIQYNPAGKFYTVGLPWKDVCSELPDNYNVCLKRLETNFRKLEKTPELLRQYDSIIQDQLKQGIVEVVDKSSPGSKGLPVHYLPHRAVVRDDKSSTKLRIVFDASSKPSKNSLSRNQCLFKGPQLTPLLFDILVRFRVHPVAIVCDLEKAFHQVRVQENQRDALRFLWVENTNAADLRVIIYRFCRVVFGLTSSPFLLNATLKHHFEQFLPQFPEFVPLLMDSLYVDDFVGGGDSAEQVISSIRVLLEILSSGGFKAHKFVTNEPEVMSSLGLPTSTDLGNESYSENLSHYSSASKVLGLPWCPQSDHFEFEFGFLLDQTSPSKREMLSTVSKIFDPLEVLAPVVVSMKCLFQECCKRKVDWDDSLPPDILEIWLEWISALRDEVVYTFPHCYGLKVNPLHTTLLCFCDASEKDYAAVVYI